jgi:hypothetical protein
MHGPINLLLRPYIFILGPLNNIIKKKSPKNHAKKAPRPPAKETITQNPSSFQQFHRSHFYKNNKYIKKAALAWGERNKRTICLFDTTRTHTHTFR